MRMLMSQYVHYLPSDPASPETGNHLDKLDLANCRTQVWYCRILVEVHLPI